MSDDPAATQCSIVERALGTDFRRLHPAIQRQYALHSGSGMACIGRGVMERVWHGPFYTWPFLFVGSLRRIMFLETGRDVPFTVENYAYRDSRGRETFTWIRTFELTKTRRFDEWLIFSERRGTPLIYAGVRQHLAVEAAASVDDNGSLCIRTSAQRVFLGPLGFRFPLFFSGSADVRETYNQRAGYYEIDVHVGHRFWGPVFGCRGWFQIEWVECSPERVPSHARPLREQWRE